jgi:hypothetical protein
MLEQKNAGIVKFGDILYHTSGRKKRNEGKTGCI